MHLLLYNRVRTLFFSSLLLFFLLLAYAIWPWCYAAWLWRSSTIESATIRSSNKIDNQAAKIPGIIHQTWRDADTIPHSWQQASSSCRQLHPDFQYRLWTDRSARELVKTEFPHLLATYDSYPYDIQRADMIRLVILYAFGGIYLDFDIICLKSLDPLRNHEFILPRTRPVGLSNDFIMAEAKHPFLWQVINDLPSFNRRFFTKYSTVMFSTGPMFLTYEATNYPNRSSIDVISQELYGKYVFNESQALFQHLKASSWHGNDAMVIKWIYRQRMVLYAVVIGVLVVSFAMLKVIQNRHLISDRCRKDSSTKLAKKEFSYSKIVNLV